MRWGGALQLHSQCSSGWFLMKAKTRRGERGEEKVKQSDAKSTLCTDRHNQRKRHHADGTATVAACRDSKRPSSCSVLFGPIPSGPIFRYRINLASYYWLLFNIIPIAVAYVAPIIQNDPLGAQSLEIPVAPWSCQALPRCRT